MELSCDTAPRSPETCNAPFTLGLRALREHSGRQSSIQLIALRAPRSDHRSQHLSGARAPESSTSYSDCDSASCCVIVLQQGSNQSVDLFSTTAEFVWFDYDALKRTSV